MVNRWEKNEVHMDFVCGGGIDIGSYNLIHEQVVVGDNVKIQSYVELRPQTVIGDNCYIDSGVKSSGKNIIGDNVTLRYDSIIARGCRIEDDCYICPQVMTNNVDHNGKQVGGAHIGKGSFIGTQTVLGAGIHIAPGTIVGSCSFVPKDITEPGIYVGVPVRKIGEVP